MKKFIGLLLVSIIFFSGSWVQIPPVAYADIDDDWALAGWQYRKELSYRWYDASVCCLDADWTNYQTKVILYSGSGTDTGQYNNFTPLLLYLNGNGKSDFTDIRFTDGSGNLFDHWIEQTFNGVNATVWIEFTPDSTTYNTITTVYAYYGNPTASDISDGEATFPFFDDFEDGTIDAKWTQATQNGGTLTETGGILTLFAPGPGVASSAAKVLGDTSFGRNSSIHFRFNNTSPPVFTQGNIGLMNDEYYSTTNGTYLYLGGNNLSGLCNENETASECDLTTPDFTNWQNYEIHRETLSTIGYRSYNSLSADPAESISDIDMLYPESIPIRIDASELTGPRASDYTLEIDYIFVRPFYEVGLSFQDQPYPTTIGDEEVSQAVGDNYIRLISNASTITSISWDSLNQQYRFTTTCNPCTLYSGAFLSVPNYIEIDGVQQPEGNGWTWNETNSIATITGSTQYVVSWSGGGGGDGGGGGGGKPPPGIDISLPTLPTLEGGATTNNLIFIGSASIVFIFAVLVGWNTVRSRVNPDAIWLDRNRKANRKKVAWKKKRIDF